MDSATIWNQRYAQGEYLYGKLPNDFLAEHLSEFSREGKILCIADGEGRNSVFLAEKGFSVTSVDISFEGLEKASRLAKERGVQIETIQADLASYDPGIEVWDSIVSIFCHLPQKLREVVHTKLVTSLRPGGILLLEGYTPDQIKNGTGGPPVPEMMHTLDGLRKELLGLNFRFAREVRRNITEGILHTGMADVVQVIAVKPA